MCTHQLYRLDSEMKRGNRCGTCRDRRVKCDGSMPMCLQCQSTSNKCQGYGSWLSWPEERDRKQGAIFFKSSRSTRPVGRLRFVNVSTWDVEIHRYLSHCASSSAQPTIPAQIPSRRLNSAAEHNLFQYFDHVVVQALATIPRTSVTLRAVIARLALSSNAQSSQAVMQSIFALSSLHRHGIQLQTIKFKTSALGALRSSSGSGIGRHEVARHIAALMLLCAYEIEQAWNSSCQWLFYINGVKNVIKASSPSIEQDTDHEYLALLDWVHYQDTMAHFSLHHWRLRKRPGKDPGFDQLVSLLPKPGVKISLKFEQPPISHFIFLRLLSEVFSTVQDKSYPTFCGEDYKNRLKLLELNISRVKNDDVSICFYEQDTARCFEVFQLAALIYITRMLGDSGDDDLEETTNSRISAGFAILAKMGTCTRQFPLLVLGCEARSDFDRITILDLIDRTRVKFPSACLVGLRNLIQTLWAQDDLAEEALEYEKKLTAVISSSETLPALF